MVRQPKHDKTSTKHDTRQEFQVFDVTICKTRYVKHETQNTTNKSCIRCHETQNTTKKSQMGERTCQNGSWRTKRQYVPKWHLNIDKMAS
jgi:hypothetical protein